MTKELYQWERERSTYRYSGRGRELYKHVCLRSMHGNSAEKQVGIYELYEAMQYIQDGCKNLNFYSGWFKKR